MRTKLREFTAKPQVNGGLSPLTILKRGIEFNSLLFNLATYLSLGKDHFFSRGEAHFARDSCNSISCKERAIYSYFNDFLVEAQYGSPDKPLSAAYLFNVIFPNETRDR